MVRVAHFICSIVQSVYWLLHTSTVCCAQHQGSKPYIFPQFSIGQYVRTYDFVSARFLCSVLKADPPVSSEYSADFSASDFLEVSREYHWLPMNNLSRIFHHHPSCLHVCARLMLRLRL